MSTNRVDYDLPPDPETEVLPEVAGNEIPSVVPVFIDYISEQEALRFPEVYDEFGSPEALVDEIEEPPIPIGRTWMWNFELGRFYFDGNTPRSSPDDEVTVIQQWIRKALTTERYAYQIYPSWFGIELAIVTSGSLNGQAAIDHLIQQIRECLIQHDRISEVDDIVAQVDGELAEFSFVVSLDNGRVLYIEEKLEI